MSGGRLVVLDRCGRDVKQYPLESGLAELGAHPRCHIRVMQPAVRPHHASVVVHRHQTVVRNIGDGETLVNGAPVSVAALRHGDLITVGDRRLRWEYGQPTEARGSPVQPALYVRARPARAPRRTSAPSNAAPRSAALKLALEMQHRASMPGNAGGKQVAVVQPQRRDTEPNAENSSRAENPSPRAQSKRSSAASAALPSTKADLWMQSRKPAQRNSLKSPRGREAAPLRTAVLKKVHHAHTINVTKIAAPLKIDHTKQAALMLMAGHTPRSKLTSPKQASATKKSPSFLVKKPSPVRKTPKGRKSTKSPKSATKDATPKGSATKRGSATERNSATPDSATPKGRATRNSEVVSATRGSLRASAAATPRRSAARIATPVKSATKNATPKLTATNATPKLLPLSGFIAPVKLTPNNVSPKRASRSPRKSSRVSGSQTSSVVEVPDSPPSPPSPPLRSPVKSALKDPHSKNSRKNDSIKFDLSNLDLPDDNLDLRSDDDFTLRYSDTSSVSTPSPRKSIHSRSSRILEKSLGESVDSSLLTSKRSLQRSTRTLTPQTPDSRRSSRGSVIVQKALENSRNSRYSRRTTKTLTDHSDATVNSAFQTRTLSPQTPQNLETYSIVDLVSMDSNESLKSGSVYDSANSSAVMFGTPQNSVGRKTRSTIDPSLVESSTPYVGRVGKKSKSRSNPDVSRKSSIKNASQSSARSSVSSRRSKSLTTPDSQLISVNSTRVSRASKSKSRINDTDLLLISDASQVEESPKTRNSKSSGKLEKSKRKSSQPSPIPRKSSRRSGGDTPAEQGLSTPENGNSPEDAGTPVLSIQSLLDSSQSSFSSQQSKKRVSANVKRKTIGVLRSEPKRRSGGKSKSMSFTARRGLLRLSNDSDPAEPQSKEKMVTPKSGVQLVQEAVKNKHSTAKKPQSKRSIIDNLDESDIVKQLFNSPVKRKLSQSMTEFSRKQLFDDDEVAAVRRPTRNTIALTGRTPDNSILEHTEAFTPERFVSPISTPSDSPNVSGIKRLFRKNTPENDLRNIKGVKSLLRTPRARRSVKNDLTNVSGVKRVFGKSPKNRLSDVRVKEVFAKSPKDDLRRVSGVKSLFQSQKKAKSPKNDLTDVRGVKSLFKGKRASQRNSPKNDLTDVRGVKRMFREEKRIELDDVSGIEELFNESNTSNRDSDSLFDRLLGKPTVKAVYSKSLMKKTPKNKSRNAKSLHSSIDKITTNVEEWLEEELKKRLDKKKEKSNVTINRELQKLVTDTVEGGAPIRTSRSRTSDLNLPLKKRSLAEPVAEAEARPRLPIKKRVVMHSTPVKGRGAAMNASELGRVSPIALDHDISISSEKPKEPQAIPEPVVKGRRGTKAKVNKEVSVEKPPSPRKTRNAHLSPPKPKTRARNTETKAAAKKSRPSLVLPKKSPVMSPKPSPKPRTRRGKAQQETPAEPEVVKEVKVVAKKTRGGKKVESPVKATPKKTRGQKVAVVVTKPSPKAKPAVEKATKRTRKTAEESNKVESPKKTKTRAKKAAETEVKQKTAKEPKIEAKTEKATRSRKIVEEVAPKRTRKNVTNDEPKKTSKKSTEPEKNVKNSRKAAEPEKKSRKAAEPEKKSRNVADPEKNEKNSRKRKMTVEEEVVPTKVSKTRAKKTEEVKTVSVQKKSVKSKVEISASDQDGGNTRTVRSKKVVVTAVIVTKKNEPKATRSKKAPEPVAEAPKANTRKRKTEVSPVNEAPKKSPAKKAKKTASPAARATRANARTEVTTKATGRSRKR